MKISALYLVLSTPYATAFGVAPRSRPTLGTKPTTTQIGYTDEDKEPLSGKSCPFSRFLRDGLEKNAYSERQREPTSLEKISQRFQMHTISRPNGVLARTIQPLVTLIEGQAANLPPYLSDKRAAFGENFCTAGQVVLGGWEDVSMALTSPQARKVRLGTAVLNAKRLPMQDRNLFPLAISQEEVGGDGSHEAYRAAIFKYVMDASQERQRDAVAQSLMDQLVEDYSNMEHGENEASVGKNDFFESNDRGLRPFLNKYLHYCMFDINPEDKETMDTLYSFYFKGVPAAIYFLDVLGGIYNFVTRDSFSDKVKVEEIYENSPPFAAFPDGSDEVMNISKKEFSQIWLSVMSIAGTAGPKHLLEVALGRKTIPLYKEGVDTTKIKPTEIWDKIDLDDKGEVMAYILECGRLNQPVGHTHRVATEDFTVKMLGRKRTFPKGTIISIPINMSCVNKNLYGETTFEFDHNRPNIAETSTIFHSVGQEHAGRSCPGTGFAMTMISEILTKCGETRRGTKF
jgi:hypothetical protein